MKRRWRIETCQTVMESQSLQKLDQFESSWHANRQAISQNMVQNALGVARGPSPSGLPGHCYRRWLRGWGLRSHYVRKSPGCRIWAPRPNLLVLNNVFAQQWIYSREIYVLFDYTHYVDCVHGHPWLRKSTYCSDVVMCDSAVEPLGLLKWRKLKLAVHSLAPNRGYKYIHQSFLESTLKFQT